MARLKLASLALAAVLISACGASPTPAPTASPAPAPVTNAVPASGIDAAGLYAGNCAVCHGASRQGVASLGPALTPQRLGGVADGALRDTVTNGRPGTSMQSFKGRLSPQEIDALVQFTKNVAP